MLPWNETTADNERLKLIQFVVRNAWPVTTASRALRVTPKTAHKWLARYREHGLAGLQERSRAPHTHPNATRSEVAERIIAFKREQPGYGPKKLIALLREREPQTRWPAISTASGILDREGLVARRKPKRRATPWSQPFAQAVAPNDVWAIDFKGWFRTADGQRVNPLTVQDAASRYLLACVGLEHPTGPAVQDALTRLFHEFGLPRVIHSDNGPPFASVGLASLSPLAVWWVKLGISPERITPGRPEQNGRLERLHRTLKAAVADPPQSSPLAQQRAFDAFRHSYNTERPHEALGQRPPALLYYPSPRPYPPTLPEPDYPAGLSVRRVRHNGQIKWQGRLIYLSEALIGEPVALRPHANNDWLIQFGPLAIGLLNSSTFTIDKCPVQVLPMSPV